MEDRKLDEMFRSLKDREIIPSSNALKELQEALNEADKREKKRKPIVVGWVAAVAAMIMLAIGINIYSTHTPALDKATIVEAEVKTELKEALSPEKVIPKTDLAEVGEVVEKFENTEHKSQKTSITEVENPTRNTKGIAEQVSEETQEEKATKQKEHTQLAENLGKVDASDLDKKLAELLKPIDDATLDSLIQQEQVALAMEEMSEEDIMNLLREAQAKLEAQGETQLAYSAERLLHQAEMELESNKSLQSILNKAIEIGVAEVQSLFKRQ
ncbi:MAG TPA: hypothetical protein VKX30_02960 [Flavobacteriaceae bacterium]|nr:hypothetical protein [Flavobacteriaceae bacterium]